MRTFRLLWSLLRYESLNFVRNPIAGFFTVAMPLIFLFLLCFRFGNQQYEIQGQQVHLSTFYVPALAALAVIGACYTNLAMTISITRDAGLLKRYRGTPMPMWAFLAGKLTHAVLLGLMLVAILIFIGIVVFDVSPPAGPRLAGLAATLILGSATFCALGLAVTAAIPNAQASAAIVQASVLPLLFISDVFVPMRNAPEWLQAFASVFPIRHLSMSLQAAFNPSSGGVSFEWLHLGVLALWLVAALLVVRFFFRWLPRR